MKVAVAVAALAACSYQAKGRVVSWSQLGDPGATRIYNYMNTAGGQQETRVDSLLDEAVIVSLQSGAACFGLTIRSTLRADLHPSQWNVTVNGASSHVEQIAEREVDTWSTTYTTEEVVLRKQTTRGETTRETTITAPVERTGTDGVVVRHARVCAPVAQGAMKLRLAVELKHPFGDEDWGQIYEWQLRS
jgi:hypothetical protein